MNTSGDLNVCYPLSRPKRTPKTAFHATLSICYRNALAAPGFVATMQPLVFRIQLVAYGPITGTRRFLGRISGMSQADARFVPMIVLRGVGGRGGKKLGRTPLARLRQAPTSAIDWSGRIDKEKRQRMWNRLLLSFSKRPRTRGH